MHALPSHPRSPFLLGLVVLAFALLAIAAAAPELGTLDFSLPAGGGGAADTVPAAQPQVTAPEPAWTADPLAPPVDTLAGSR